jgi:hypothetical protein
MWNGQYVYLYLNRWQPVVGFIQSLDEDLFQYYESEKFYFLLFYLEGLKYGPSTSVTSHMGLIPEIE